MLCAALGLVLWYFTDTAIYALAITISISLLGGTVTVAKAFRDPHSETMASWFASMIASLCALVSIGTIDWIIMAYPLYLLTLNGAIVSAILLGKARDTQSRIAELDIEKP